MSSPQAPAPKPLGTTEWLICFIAVIGFAIFVALGVFAGKKLSGG